MKTLVWIEHDNVGMKDASLAAITAASKLGEVHALVAGHNCGDVAKQAAEVAGVATVHIADDASLANALAENVAPLIADFDGPPTTPSSRPRRQRARTSRHASPRCST